MKFCTYLYAAQKQSFCSHLEERAALLPSKNTLSLKLAKIANLLLMIFTFATTMILSGCSVMAPVNSAPDVGYVINTVPQHIVKSHPRNKSLLVMYPDTNPAYNTKQIAFMQRSFQISYYSINHWIETPADMFMPLIAETLQNTHHFRAIITPPYTGTYDYALRTQIKLLRVDYNRRIPVMQLSIQAQLIRASSGNVMASREFKSSMTLTSRTPYSAVIAANRAGSIVLRDMVAWVVAKT